MKSRYVLIILATVVFSGCIKAHKLPPELTQDQLQSVNNSPLSNLVVAISNNHDIPVHIYQDFVKLVQDSKVFKESDSEENLKNQPDLIIELKSISKYPSCGTGMASLSIMTLGVIPMGGVDQNYGFSITNKNHNKSLNYKYTYIEKMYFGLFTGLLNFSKNWSPYPKPERNKENFALLLVKNKEDILSLVK